MTSASDDPLASVAKIERKSTAEETAGGIRDLILGGELKPGAPLTEIPLAQAFGVSRSAIREALASLVHEGIVTQHRHRGAVVATLTTQNIRDLSDARRLIETAAIDASKPSEDHAGFDALETALEELEAGVEADDWSEIPKADVRFHRALVGLLHNAKLEGFYAQLETELRFATLVATRWDALHGESVVDEHRGIYELLRAGKRKECKARLLEILDDTEQHLLANIAADAD